jgi:hypothetical protein
LQGETIEIDRTDRQALFKAGWLDQLLKIGLAHPRPATWLRKALAASLIVDAPQQNLELLGFQDSCSGGAQSRVDSRRRSHGAPRSFPSARPSGDFQR